MDREYGIENTGIRSTARNERFMGSARKCNRQLNRRRTSNAGFSLVELLIAVTILAIIVIPMLHLFVTSTRINVKSRQMLRATTVAQDIMEGLKAYTLEEVRTKFTPEDGVSASDYFFPTDGFYILNTRLLQGEGGVREITELEGDNPDDPASQIFYFGIKNLKMQGGEYDALIKLDASTYGIASAEGSAPGAGAHDNEFNGAFFAEIGSVEETNGEGTGTDSSYHEHKRLNDAVLKDIKTQIEGVYASSGTDLPADWDDKKLEDLLTKRTIDVVIEDAGSLDASGNPQCKAAITFKYECTYNGATYTSYGDIGSPAGEVKGITRTFSSGNFYLFYYPVYKTGQTIDNINFQINNADKLFDADNPMLKNITLAKQIRSDVDTEHRVIAPELSDAELKAKESAYLARVSVSADRALDNKLFFRTNVNTNMSNQAKSYNPATGQTEWEELPESNVYISTSANVYPMFKQIALTGDNVSGKVTNIIYDIEITIYETGAAEHFSDPDFETNNDVHKLATITNLD